MICYEYQQSGIDEYGQPTFTEGSPFEMNIYPNTRINVDDIRFAEATDIGLSKYRTSAPIIYLPSGERYSLLYSIPSKRYNTYFLRKI